MEDKKEEIKQEQLQERNLLEVGKYEIYGPDSGEISIEKIELAGHNGAKRIWKVKSISEKEIILDIEKFG